MSDFKLYRFRIRTTKITIDTAATTREAAIAMVMAAEQCPRNAIRGVKVVGRIV